MRLIAARRVLVAAAFTTLLAGSLATAPPASASTAATGLELSLDGNAWSESIPEALFAELPVLVPGDTITRDLLVRNVTGTDALLRIDAVEVRIENADFASSLRIGAALAPTAGGAVVGTGMVPLDGSDDCTGVLPSASLGADDVATIVISLHFDENATMPSQLSSAGLSLLLSASQDIGQVAASPACPVDGIQLPVLALPDDPSPSAAASTADAESPTFLGLALTGAAVAPLVATGGALVLLGLGAVAITRRRERAE